MTPRPLVFFVDERWKRAGGLYTPLLHPFWGNPIEEVSLFAKQLADSYPFDTRSYSITAEREKADMVLVPYKHNWLLAQDPDLLGACIAASRESGLPLLIDGMSDIQHPIDIPNAYVLRYAGYRFKREGNAIYLPPLADDLLERTRGGQLQIRDKQPGAKPVVGFAGWGSMSLSQRLRTFIKELPIRLRALIDSRYRACTKGVWWRERALRTLSRSSDVAANFLVRTSFSGSAKTAAKGLVELREEFVANLLESDYGLAVRGDGNASTRLFETLSLGRIPVIVDTECILPFADVVDYREFSFTVDYRDLRLLPQRLAEFHASLSPERFRQMQQNAREAFVQHFRPDALMPQVLRELAALRTAAALNVAGNALQQEV